MERSRFKLISIILLVIGVIFSGITASFSQQQSPAKISPKPVAPAAGIKLDVSIRSQIQLSPEIHNKLLAISRDLITQNLSSELLRGISSRAETNVTRQTPKGYIAETIVLNLLRDTYTAEMSRIEFSFEDGRANIIKMDKIYQPKVGAVQIQVPKNINLERAKLKILDSLTAVTKPQLKAATKPQVTYQPKGLVNTPCTEFPSAVNATNEIHAIMSQKFGGNVQKLIGSASTKNAITNFLKNDDSLLAWNNIGHGVTSHTNGAPCYGLVQSDQTIWHNELAALNPYSGIYGCVILTNSCNSYKDPLNSAIWSRGPRTYIGGNINLHVNRSEFAAKNFWHYTLIQGKTMRWSLEQAQRDKGYPVGTYGLRGDEGLLIRGEGSSGGTSGGSEREGWPPTKVK